MDEQQVYDLARYRDSPAFSALEVAVLDLVVGMTRTPAQVPEELIARLERQLSPAALVELVTTIAWENHTARWNVAFGIESLGFSDGAVCALPERP